MIYILSVIQLSNILASNKTKEQSMRLWMPELVLYGIILGHDIGKVLYIENPAMDILHVRNVPTLDCISLGRMV